MVPVRRRRWPADAEDEAVFQGRRVMRAMVRGCRRSAVNRERRGRQVVWRAEVWEQDVTRPGWFARRLGR